MDYKKLKSICEVKGIKLLKPLGDGAQGVIYHGYRRKTNDQYAIKVQQLSTKLKQTQFQNELEVMASLQQLDRVVSLKQSFLYQENAFIVMEKMDTDLMDYVLNQIKLSEEETRRIFYEICLAVRDCHERQIAHLDLKPENVLLNFQKTAKNERIPVVSTVKLCDFGHSHSYSANYLNASDKKNIYVPNHFYQRGTKQYRAPEMDSDEEINLEKSDVWSLGVIMFVMLTGCFPQASIPKSSLTSGCDYRSFSNFLGEDDDSISILNLDIMRNFASDKCCALLESLLLSDPDYRLSIDELLHSDWFNTQLMECDEYEELYSPSSTAASNPSLTATR